MPDHEIDLNCLVVIPKIIMLEYWHFKQLLTKVLIKLDNIFKTIRLFELRFKLWK